MRKLDSEKLRELIEYEAESGYIDFKKEQYKNNNEALIKDIMSMVNSDSQGDKYIIIGVKDDITKRREIVGITDDIADDSVYQQIISENIEPRIEFSYMSDSIDNKKIAYFYISSNNGDRPYMVKKDNKNLRKGDAFKRIGSSQRKLIRRDYDEIYKNDKKYFLMNKKINSYKCEIKLIEQLNIQRDYLRSKNGEIKRNIEDYREYLSPITNKRFIMNKIPSDVDINEWQDKIYKEIINFNVKNHDQELINRLIEKIDIKNSYIYIYMFSEMNNDYDYLNNIQLKLSKISKFNNNEIESKINNLNLRDIRCGFGGIFNYCKRIEELKILISELEALFI